MFAAVVVGILSGSRQKRPTMRIIFHVQVSESVMKAVNNEVESFAGGEWAGIVRECVEGALATNLIAEDDQIVSLYHRYTISPKVIVCMPHVQYCRSV